MPPKTPRNTVLLRDHKAHHDPLTKTLLGVGVALDSHDLGRM